MALLKLWTGCMSSGKTTSLLQANHDYLEAGYNNLIIKPCTDTRDGKQKEWGKIKSRIIDDNVSCFYVNSIDYEFLSYIIDKNSYNLLFVDEAQFFKKSDIWELSKIVDEKHINAFCYGIKTDSNGHLFEGIEQLMAIADDIYELDHICGCGERKATMHVRYVNGEVDIGGNAIAIDGVDNVEYKSVCRKCWKKLVGYK